MTGPALKDGDVITWDGETFKVVSYNLQDKSYWLQEEPSGTYYTMKLLHEDKFSELWAKGEIKIGSFPRIKGGSGHHYHSWQQYKGFTEVYEYCACGAKKENPK